MLSDEIKRTAPLVLYRTPQGEWSARPELGITPPLIEQYGALLAMWWRSSPSALLECRTCGEVRLTGKRTKKNCGSCVDGKFAPMDLDGAFARPRPRARKVKLK